MKALLPISGFSFLSTAFKNNDDNFQRKTKDASVRSERLIKLLKEKSGVPGICVKVNINGNHFFDFNYGYSDVENLKKVKSNSLMRIASISKSFTSLIVAQLIDEGLLDLDIDINEYIPDFPKKTLNNEQVVITCRQLLSHRSGIRDYATAKDVSEYQLPEFLNVVHCNDALSTRKCFENDPLIFAPGTQYLYSVYAYVLLGSVLEKVAQKSVIYGPLRSKNPENIQYLELMFKTLFKNQGLMNTYCEYYQEILPNRSRQYMRKCEKRCKLLIAPYVDNSCKWAAGGLVSTCEDLTKIAQDLVDIWLRKKDGFINRKTLQIMWTPDSKSPIKIDLGPSWGYGLGWAIKEDNNRFLVGHTGGATGGTSVLIINIPKNSVGVESVIVAILCNMEELSESIGELAVQISKLFEEILN